VASIGYNLWRNFRFEGKLAKSSFNFNKIIIENIMPTYKSRRKTKAQRETEKTIEAIAKLPISTTSKFILIVLVCGLPLLCIVGVFVAYVLSSITKTLPPNQQTVFSGVTLAIFVCLIVFAVWGAVKLIQKAKRAEAARRVAWERSMAFLSQTPTTGIGKSVTTTNVKELTPYELEMFAVSLFRTMGYKVVHTGKTHDGGIDVHLTNPNGRSELVQCKQWSKPVGEPEVRDLAGAMLHEKAVRGYILAPGGFTENARRWAADKGIMLADVQGIERLVISTYEDQIN
jgi:hypothetical protein